MVTVKARICGSTLIEVLVAIVVLGIGTIGFSAMQFQSVTVVNDAYYRTQAILIAQDVIERIKANPRGWPDYYESQVWQGSDVVAGKPCTASVILGGMDRVCDRASQVAEFDHFEVSQQLRASLPKAAVSVYRSCYASVGVSCVEVGWSNANLGSGCSVASAGIDEVMERRCVSIKFIAHGQY